MTLNLGHRIPPRSMRVGHGFIAHCDPASVGESHRMSWQVTASKRLKPPQFLVVYLVLELHDGGLVTSQSLMWRLI